MKAIVDEFQKLVLEEEYKRNREVFIRLGRLNFIAELSQWMVEHSQGGVVEQKLLRWLQQRTQDEITAVGHLLR